MKAGITKRLPKDNEGWNNKAIAQGLRIHEETVRQQVKQPKATRVKVDASQQEAFITSYFTLLESVH